MFDNINFEDYQAAIERYFNSSNLKVEKISAPVPAIDTIGKIEKIQSKPITRIVNGISIITNK